MNGFTQFPKLILPLLVFSLVSNLAVLISPIFMMQVLDRVIPSGNVNTLLLLGGLACGALIVQAAVETARDLSLGRVSRWSEAMGASLALAPGQKDSQGVIDRSLSVADFFSGGLAIIALSIPWIPIFLMALWLLHPSFVILVFGLVALSAVLRWAQETLAGPDLRLASEKAREEQVWLKNAVQYSSRMGMAIVARHLRARYIEHQTQKHIYQNRGAFSQTWTSAGAGFLRSLAQILSLALGAYLVTVDSLSVGGMIAASIIMSKTFGTCETGLSKAGRIRQALFDIRALSELRNAEETQTVEQTELSGTLRVEGLTIPRGQGKPPRVDRVSFSLEAGQCLAIVGGSGSGKSSLLQALNGIQPSLIGSVFLDSSEIRSLTDRELFYHTGVLSQQSKLLAGTVAENISCFSPEPDTDRIIDAARTAGVHGLISALPQGYRTDLGEHLELLSLGQRQRVALARAVYMKPKYLFLDEPNALLDADGERALSQALHRLKDQSVTIIMVLQRSGIMWLADKVLKMEHGRNVDFGDRKDVLGRMLGNRHQVELPLMTSAIGDLTDWIATRFTRASDEAFSQRAQLVGSELFNFALGNGDQDRARTVKFTFSFNDDTHCEIKMIEEGATVAEGKIKKIRAMSENPASQMSNLAKDEQSLAIVDQLSEKFEVTNIENHAMYAVALANRNANQSGHA